MTLNAEVQPVCAVADDDARPHDQQRQLAGVLAERPLALELRLLVGVAEALPDIEVGLEEAAAEAAGDVRGRHVQVAAQVPALGDLAAELEHPQGAARVHLARLLERAVEGDRRGAVDHARDALDERATVLRGEAEVLGPDVARPSP